MRLTLSIVVPATFLAASGVSAQMPGDLERGADLSQRWCSSCHLVEAEGVGSDTAPPFRSIAIDPELSNANIRDWLISPHDTMPSFDLAEDEIADIIAYIASIRAED